MIPKSTPTAAVKKAPAAAPAAPGEKPLPKWALPAGVGGFVLAIALVVTLGWYTFGPDGQLMKVRALQREMYTLAFMDLSEETQKAKRDTYRAEFEKLKREFKEDVREEERKAQIAQRTAWLKRFFNQWSEEQRNTHMDNEIDRQVEREKAFAKARAERDAAAGQPAQPPAGAPADAARGNRGNRGGQPGGGAPGGFGGAPGGRGNNSGLSAADQGLRDDYAAAVKARRAARGIPVPERPANGPRPAA